MICKCGTWIEDEPSCPRCGEYIIDPERAELSAPPKLAELVRKNEKNF